MGRPRVPVAKRLWRRVDKTGDCWTWTGYVNHAGYGVLKDEDRWWRVHRLAWTLTRGVIPLGVHVLHRCDNPGCVNPEHLFLGDHADNMADKASKGRAAQKLTPWAVREIRRRYAAGGVTQKDLGERFGVDQSVVSDVVRRESWRHV